MKWCVVLFFLIFGLVQYSFSQGEFLKRGRTGVGANAGFSTNQEMNGKYLFAGFSYKGILDLGCSYWKASGGKIRDDVFIPSITYYPVKQEDAKRAPTVGVSFGFSRYHYLSVTTEQEKDTGNVMSWRPTQQVLDLKVDALRFGITASHRVRSWKYFFFQPIIGAQTSIASSKWEFALRFGISIGSRIKGGPMVILTPALERQSNLTTFMCTAGLVY
jgi:hypothetical protein